tara:strand:- start:114 stop:611 length:498 start_codon:yes stop_codon:yes gene_type:complete
LNAAQSLGAIVSSDGAKSLAFASVIIHICWVERVIIITDAKQSTGAKQGEAVLSVTIGLSVAWLTFGCGTAVQTNSSRHVDIAQRSTGSITVTDETRPVHFRRIAKLVIAKVLIPDTEERLTRHVKWAYGAINATHETNSTPIICLYACLSCSARIREINVAVGK